MKNDAEELRKEKIKQNKKDYNDNANNDKKDNFLKVMKDKLYNNEKNINDLAENIGRNKIGMLEI